MLSHILAGIDANVLFECAREVIGIGETGGVGCLADVVALREHLAGALQALVADVVTHRHVHEALHLYVQQTAADAEGCGDVLHGEVAVAQILLHQLFHPTEEVAVDIRERSRGEIVGRCLHDFLLLRV